MKPATAALLLPLLLFTSSLAAQSSPEWRDKEAEIRLRAAPFQVWAHQLRIDVPPELSQDIKGVSAWLSSGTRLSSKPIFLHGKIVAAEVYLPRTSSALLKAPEGHIATPVEIYLRKTPGEKNYTLVPGKSHRPAEIFRLPFSLSSLTTRPFTSAEAERLICMPPRYRRNKKNRPYLFPYSYDIFGIGKIWQKPAWLDPGARRVVILQWNTSILLEKPSTIAFGSDQSHTAWFAFVDNQPVADWRSTPQCKTGERMGKKREYAAGFHHLRFLVLQRHEEKIPTFLWDKDGKIESPPVAEQYSARFSPTVLVETRDGSARAGYHIQKLTPLVPETVWKNLLDYSIVPLTDSTAPPTKTPVTVEGQQLSFPKVPFGKTKLHFPKRQIWHQLSRFRFSTRLGTAPVVLSATQSLEAKIIPDERNRLTPDLEKRIHFSWKQFDGKGKILAEKSFPLLSAGGNAPILKLSPSSAATRLAFSCQLGGIDISPEQTLHFLRPEDDLRNLRASGNSLFQNGKRVILICNPQQALPMTKRKPESLTILDDFWATTDGPNADLLPENRLTSNLCQTKRIDIPHCTPPGAARNLRKFSAFSQALLQKPNALLFAFGRDDLASGQPPLELCRQLLFLAQASHANNIKPLFMTLPTMPGIPTETTRLSALLTKELAFHLELETMDVYSREKRDEFNGKFARFFRNGDGTILFSTPNNEGRERLLDIVSEALNQ